MLTIGSLFAGIGGLDLGLEMAGLGPVLWQVEQGPFCRSVLARHWPDVERFEDVREVGGANLPAVDVVCGGFPCQDVSSAGKGAGLSGERSGLWFEFARIVAEVRPAWVVVENVASGAKRWVDAVVSGLGQLGYETLPIPLSAADVGAPHLRKRIFVVARNSNGDGEPTKPVNAQMARVPSVAGSVAHSQRIPVRQQQGRGRGAGREGAPEPRHDGDGNAWGNGPPVSPVCGVDDGLPHRVDRLRALGNAVVPQCAEVIGHIIRELIHG